MMEGFFLTRLERRKTLNSDGRRLTQGTALLNKRTFAISTVLGPVCVDAVTITCKINRVNALEHCFRKDLSCETLAGSSTCSSASLSKQLCLSWLLKRSIPAAPTAVARYNQHN